MTGRDNTLWIALEAVGHPPRPRPQRGGGGLHGRRVRPAARTAGLRLRRLRPRGGQRGRGPGRAVLVGQPGRGVDVRDASCRSVPKGISGTRPGAAVRLRDEVGCRGVGSHERPEARPRGRAARPLRRARSRLPGDPERSVRGGGAGLRSALRARQIARAAARSSRPDGCRRRGRGPRPQRRPPTDHPRRQRHPSVRGVRRPSQVAERLHDPGRHKQRGQGQHRRDARARPRQRGPLLAQLRQRRAARRGRGPGDRDAARRPGHRLVPAHPSRSAARARERRSRRARPELPDRARPSSRTHAPSSRPCSTRTTGWRSCRRPPRPVTWSTSRRSGLRGANAGRTSPRGTAATADRCGPRP